ncbi:hypothetical protein, partial [Salinarimonas ramus]|uniref:hypothetical protein n=1 Tax=Salinarimonas ramus TaxID=690164 RepID=UPI00166584C3
MLFRALFLSLLFVGPALAQTHHDVPLFCAGSGRLVSSEVTGTFPTHRYTVPGSASDDPASIAVGRCGREITVDVQGHRLFLVPDAVGDGWSGTLRIDGFATLYSFSRAGPRLLVGTWVTHAEGGRMDAEMRLVVVDGRAPDMEGCTDGAPEPLPARGTSFGRAALA